MIKCDQITQGSHGYIPHYKQLYGIRKPSQDMKIEHTREIEILKKKQMMAVRWWHIKKSGSGLQIKRGWHPGLEWLKQGETRDCGGNRKGGSAQRKGMEAYLSHNSIKI